MTTSASGHLWLWSLHQWTSLVYRYVGCLVGSICKSGSCGCHLRQALFCSVNMSLSTGLIVGPASAEACYDYTLWWVSSLQWTSQEYMYVGCSVLGAQCLVHARFALIWRVPSR